MTDKEQITLGSTDITKPCLTCSLPTNLQLYSFYPYTQREGNMIVESRPYHKKCAPAEYSNQPYAKWSFIGESPKFAHVTKSKDRTKGTFKIWRVKR